MNIFTNGLELRKLRKDIGLSQSKLSEITGLVQAKISAYELGKNGLSESDKAKIGKAINCLDRHSIKKLKIKRYQKHVRNGNTLANRISRSYTVTKRNNEYLSLLSELESNFLKPLPFSAPKALSFFAGCGGLCYGIRAAGFNIVGASEIHEGFRKIYFNNFPDTIPLTNDVRQFSEKDCESILKKAGSIALMIGGPPCQGFSLTGKRDPRDARNTLFADYLRIAKSIMPQVVLMENVKLLTSMKDPNGHLVTERILSEFSKIGYDADFFCLNAKCYGVPQHRERVIFLATNKKTKKKPSIPLPEFAEQADLLGLIKPFFTFGDAVSDLDFIESGEKSKIDNLHEAVSHPEHVIEWLVDVPEGSSAHENKDPNLRPPSGYNTTYKRQVWNEPGATVATTFAMISGCRNVHPVATRSITTREALRLQSFPDSFRFSGKTGDIRTAIGNAVPPILAYALGRHILKTYIL
jgi:DNA (cytosine-5)-methyltransferase 1